MLTFVTSGNNSNPNSAPCTSPRYVHLPQGRILHDDLLLKTYITIGVPPFSFNWISEFIASYLGWLNAFHIIVFTYKYLISLITKQIINSMSNN